MNNDIFSTRLRDIQPIHISFRIPLTLTKMDNLLNMKNARTTSAMIHITVI